MGKNNAGSDKIHETALVYARIRAAELRCSVADYITRLIIQDAESEGLSSVADKMGKLNEVAKRSLNDGRE